MFERVFVEKDIFSHSETQALLKRIPGMEANQRQGQIQLIDKLENYFGRVKKPYLQKREQLNLFIGTKRGQTIKPAPPAYGMSGDPHYYFIHSYNCIYECEYCYLQGYFHSPDLVFYTNHHEIAQSMRQTIIAAEVGKTPWFHAGEFSDSLALSHITGELPIYWQVMQECPQARLELRTKSANIREVLKLPTLKNIYISFSLAPAQRVQKTEHRTAPLTARLAAMKKLADRNFSLGIHFDPIIYQENILEEYSELIEQIFSSLDPHQISYLSMGVVRFTKDVYHQVQKNYPTSDIHNIEFAKSFDEKVRYPRHLRMHILNSIKQILLSKDFPEEKIYFCME